MKRRLLASSCLNSASAATLSQSVTSASSSAVNSCAGFDAPRPSGATSVAAPTSGVKSPGSGSMCIFGISLLLRNLFEKPPHLPHASADGTDLLYCFESFLH
jgi:hypothetical protein